MPVGHSSGDVAGWGLSAPQPPRRSPPAPPAPSSGATGGGGGDARSQLMQLVPLFGETKQFLRQVETVDSSSPRLEPSASIDTSGGSRAQLMELVPLFAETKEFLRKVETVDKSAPRLSDDGGGEPAPEPASHQQLTQLVPLFAETKQFLRKVETVDKSAPQLAGWGASPPPPPAPPPAPELSTWGASPAPPAPSAQLGQEHLQAIESAASIRSQRRLLALKEQLGGMFAASGVSLERAFRAFDANGDGDIDYDEFASGLVSLGAADITEAQLGELIRVLDTDGSGRVDYTEFARWFGGGPPPPPPPPEVRAREEARQVRASLIAEHFPRSAEMLAVAGGGG